MGWEPITCCPECGEPHDVYMAPGERVCPECAEFLAEREQMAAMAWFDIMEGNREHRS